MKIIRDDWCWEANQHDIEVSTADVTIPVFKHVGFAVNVMSSHDAAVSTKIYFLLNQCRCLKTLSHILIFNFTGNV